jgi:hypothetical protein
MIILGVEEKEEEEEELQPESSSSSSGGGCVKPTVKRHSMGTMVKC